MNNGSRNTVFRHIAVLVALTVVAAPWTAAQATFGTIRGAVRDAAGGFIPGVSVTVTNQATNVRRTVVSDDRGNYEVTAG